jgi:cathepsin B
MAHIMKGGTLVAGFLVYQDFFAYRSGVYQHETGEAAGGHAARVIGWGTEAGTPYWLAVNSWGSEWGMSGWAECRL